MHSKVNSVFLAWQDPLKREWHPVGKLTRHGDHYQFQYTRGAGQSKRFTPFTGMEDLTKVYQSEQLFPLFANRLLSERRPEYKLLLSWLGIEGQHCPLLILAKTGGFKNTDNLQVFPEVQQNTTGSFEFDFFVHGVRYVSDSARARIKTLQSGDPLLLMQDFQNPKDPMALVIRTNEAPEIVGYCPRYLAKGIHQLMTQEADLTLVVKRANDDAPLYYQLMCTLTVKTEDAKSQCELFDDEAFKPFCPTL
ncbi:HIRAN domain-containing protein [Endozoicomonas sp. 4G]|uniref:HIRAN domain-containing protein n=1 Tax=Endozoicomonas sp. 4G TaxID=2872754 RepID=UPI002078C221|nr:HIRAN domain-containing protein [Endozoicomonas sp. 4G]